MPLHLRSICGAQRVVIVEVKHALRDGSNGAIANRSIVNRRDRFDKRRRTGDEHLPGTKHEVAIKPVLVDLNLRARRQLLHCCPRDAAQNFWPERVRMQCPPPHRQSIRWKTRLPAQLRHRL